MPVRPVRDDPSSVIGTSGTIRPVEVSIGMIST